MDYPSVNGPRLMQSIADLGRMGALPGGGVKRLALTPEDQAARDLIVARMAELGLTVRIDRIGNLIGLRPGLESGPPVMMGSHIDTVATGGLYDGNYGVLSGLEVVAALNDRGRTTRRPLAVAVFTNEEGVRFHPDMLGSLVFAGGLPLAEALNHADQQGVTLGQALRDIGYDGPAPETGFAVDRYLELHIEQGPVLDGEKVRLGVVEGVQGISWTEFTLAGVANHAGTTPMGRRRDAGHAAAKIMVFARELTAGPAPGLVATVGRVSAFGPGMVNVIPNRVVFTVDMRHYRPEVLGRAKAALWAFAEEAAAAEGVGLTRQSLADFPTVPFDEEIKALIETQARALGLSCRRLPSGAGHDAQMLARICPSGMIFVPNRDGLSHNTAEHAEPEHLIAGAQVLLQAAVALADRP